MVVPAWILAVLRTLHIISFPIMVFLWFHYILGEFSLNSDLYRSLLIIASYPLAFLVILAVGDLHFKRFFLFDADNHPPIGGLGFLSLVVLCLVYSMAIFFYCLLSL